MNDTTTAGRFAPPGTHVEDLDAVDGPQLATRGQRFGAAIVDSIFTLGVMFGVMLPMYGLGYAHMMAQSKLMVLPGLSIYLVIVYAVEGWFLHRRSQSLGKMALGLRIVRPDGSAASFGRSFFMRLFLFGMVAFVPFIGPFWAFIDALFIFGAARRCLHDYFADTIVVTAVSSPLESSKAARH